MAMPVLKVNMEISVEQRVAILETSVQHIRSDISEMKVDLRRLNDKVDAVDAKLTAKIDAGDQKLSDKIDAVKDSVTSLALTMEKSFAELKIGRVLDRVWWLLIAGALLGVMARGFKSL